MCVNDIQVCEQVIRIQVIGIWRVSCIRGIYVFESVSWKVSCVQGIYVLESVSWKQTLQVIYSTSQKFGHTNSFQGFSLFFTIFYIVNNSEHIKTMKKHICNHVETKKVLNKSKYIQVFQSSPPFP